MSVDPAIPVCTILVHHGHRVLNVTTTVNYSRLHMLLSYLGTAEGSSVAIHEARGRGLQIIVNLVLNW